MNDDQPATHSCLEPLGNFQAWTSSAGLEWPGTTKLEGCVPLLAFLYSPSFFTEYLQVTGELQAGNLLSPLETAVWAKKQPL